MSTDASTGEVLRAKWADANGHTYLPDIGIQEERWIRDRYDHWIVGQTGTDSTSHLHIPKEDTEDCNNPVCDTKASDWNNKHRLIYPEGFKDICKRCFSRVFDDE